MAILPAFWSGCTLGKRLGDIRIVKTDGTAPGLITMLLREVVAKWELSFATFGVTGVISIFMAAFQKDKRTIHNLIAGTTVVHR